MQRQALEAAGAGIICTEAEMTIDEFVKDKVRARKPREKRDVVLVTTTARLTGKRAKLNAVIAAIHAKRAVVAETTTGRRSDKPDQLQSMIFDAIAEQVGDAKAPLPEEAKSRGAKGGRQKGKNADKRRTPRALALKSWRNMSLTTAAALATPEMEGWTQAAAYRLLKKRNTARGTKIGRPRLTRTGAEK